MSLGEWGQGEWGETPWGGQGAGGTAPVITPLDPVDNAVAVPQLRPLTIRFTDDVGVDRGRVSVTVGGLIWVLGGVAINGASMTVTPNIGNGFDLVITPPAPYPYGSRQEVLVVAGDADGNVSSLIFGFQVGSGLRFLKARNPFENVISAYFNRQLRLDAALFVPTHWVITPISVGARPLEVVEVMARAGQANVVHLRYVGGGSIYKITALDIHGADGSSLEPGYDSAEFEIFFGDQADPTIRLFNSIWGPLGISQRTLTRRTLDDHVANRSLALALDEQFRLRMQRLDGSAGGDGRPGTQRTAR